jgi:hypothetical protein
MNLHPKPQTQLLSKFIKDLTVNVKNLKYLNDSLKGYIYYLWQELFLI